MDGWFTRFYQDYHQWDVYPRWFLDRVEAEQRATTIYWWEPLIVPGLLQTHAYARALFRVWQTTAKDDALEEQVQARIARQAIFDRPAPPVLCALIDEMVLHRCIGGQETMREQLDYLLQFGSRPLVRIHVVPAEVGAHVGLLGAFAIAGFPDREAGIVYLESPDDGETSKDPAKAFKIAQTFETLRSEALPRRASQDLIRKVAEERWSQPS
jgi:hypothetical protein